MPAFFMQKHIVPSFFLYGEPPREVAEHFLHVEALDDRSRPNNWNIRPHAHANLNHVFLITAGGGEVRAESLIQHFRAPCTILVPARIIHAFAYDNDTAGSVLTVSETFLREQLLREPAFQSLFAAPSLFEFSRASREAKLLHTSIERLASELAWQAPGHAVAVESQLLTILVALLRLDLREHGGKRVGSGRQAELVARFRQLLETEFHSNQPMEDYARTLKVSPSRLRTACVEVTDRSPLQLVQDRLLLEAKRLLLYSNMSIAEAGYYLGFDDPAYFTRFFTRSAGVSPRGFRQRKASKEG
jgi:AraC family transcriptional regulator, transcriptional activator of pobA